MYFIHVMATISYHPSNAMVVISSIYVDIANSRSSFQYLDFDCIWYSYLDAFWLLESLTTKCTLDEAKHVIVAASGMGLYIVFLSSLLISHG